jgi:hypothetical protein
MGLLDALTSLTGSTELLRDDTTRGVFEAVAEPRTILVRDLRNSFPHAQLESSIAALKQAKLIKESPAVLDGFSTLYLTAGGLGVAQALKRSR